MGIFSLRKTDPKNVKSLLHYPTPTLETGSKKRNHPFEKINQEVVVHNEAEERFFHSRLNSDREQLILIFEGIDEHRISGLIQKRA